MTIVNAVVPIHFIVVAKLWNHFLFFSQKFKNEKKKKGITSELTNTNNNLLYNQIK